MYACSTYTCSRRQPIYLYGHVIMIISQVAIYLVSCHYIPSNYSYPHGVDNMYSDEGAAAELIQQKRYRR